MKPILIVRISPSGSTEEIVGAMKTAFEAAGHRVELASPSTAPDLEAFAVVIAAPIHGMKWLPEAVEFVSSRAAALKSGPVALVAVAYLYFEGRNAWKKAIAKSLESARLSLPHASVQFFGGRLPAPLPAVARWLFGVKKGRPTDLVDRAAVKAWATDWAQTVR